jgi:DNA-binding FrmR family transcriptional regulator
MRRWFFAILLLWFCCAQLSAAPEPPLGEPLRLTLQPMPASVPALKHPLLPTLKDQKNGNAVLLYYRSFSPEWWTYGRKEVYENFENWNMQPLEEVRRDEALKNLVRTNQLKELDLAARRSYCDWELADRARQEGFSMLLPDVQSMRTNGTLLQLRARVEIAEGRFDDAVWTLQTGFGVARHMGEAPILINDLVGVAIGQRMLEEVEELIAQPNAPNLYWSLSALPRPFISMRKALEGEKAFVIEAHFRQLAERPLTPLAAEQLQELVDMLLKLAGGGRPADLSSRAALLAACLKTYPDDKKVLVASGFDAEAIERLPVLQVGFLASIQRYHEMIDDMTKWMSEPYHVAVPQLDKLEGQIRAMKAGMVEGVPLATLVVPAISKVNLAAARVDRRIAALRIIEALRLHAAANGGKLPTSLDEIKEVPIPLDPLTGKAFEYKLNGTKATLKGASPLGPGNQAYAIDYEITLRQ